MEFSQNHVKYCLNNLQKSGKKNRATESWCQKDLILLSDLRCLGRGGNRTQDQTGSVPGQGHGHHGSCPLSPVLGGSRRA